MRRKEREIAGREVLEKVLHKAPICHLAMSDNDQPYVIPLNFGYEDNALYFHCAQEGKKLDILGRNNRICFEVDIDHELVKGENACEWGMKGRSVVGIGRARLINDAVGKRQALDIIMKHYGAPEPFSYKEKGFEKALIIKVEIESMTGKKLA
jgi:nitroimidazol reductase NimA-like FMN-containing flavoprotein (pyridoxamine 5'-phosphate oxidase superfamily)